MFSVGECVKLIFDVRIIFMGVCIEEVYNVFISEECVRPARHILFKLPCYVGVDGLFGGLYTYLWNSCCPTTLFSVHAVHRSVSCLSSFTSIFLRGSTSAP